jgi:hypothetical protein
MDLVTASEARQWRRCSLAAVLVLLLSLAGEQVVTAVSPDPQPQVHSWSFSYVPHAALFRILEHFAGVSPR